MKCSSILIENSKFADGINVLFANMEETDLPKLTNAVRRISGFHALASQILGAVPEHTLTQPSEPSGLERLVASLAVRMGQQDELIGRMADEIAGLHASVTTLVEGQKKPVEVHNVTCVFPPGTLEESPASSSLHGPLGTEDFHEQAAAVEAAIAEVQAPAPPAVPSANGTLHHKSAARGERQMGIARLLAAEGPLPPMEIARRLEISEGSISSLLTCGWFAKPRPEKGTPYELTEAGQAALREAGYVVAPAPAESSSPETTAPIPESPSARPAPASREPTNVPAKAERNRLQCIVMAEAMLEAGAPMTQRGIASAAGLPEEIVEKRLKAHGPAAVSHSQLRYFLRDGDLWLLTEAGKALAGGEAVGP